MKRSVPSGHFYSTANLFSKANKYCINTNTTKAWSTVKGIVAGKDELPADTRIAKHKYVARHDYEEVLFDWWNSFTTIASNDAATYASRLCNNPFRALVVLRSTVIDIEDRKNKQTWDELTREAQVEFLKCPNTDENKASSVEIALRNEDYRR